MFVFSHHLFLRIDEMNYQETGNRTKVTKFIFVRLSKHPTVMGSDLSLCSNFGRKQHDHFPGRSQFSALHANVFLPQQLVFTGSPVFHRCCTTDQPTLCRTCPPFSRVNVLPSLPSEPSWQWLNVSFLPLWLMTNWWLSQTHSVTIWLCLIEYAF